MKLAAWMRKNSWDEEALANALGCTQPTINRLKRGANDPSWSIMRALSKLTRRQVRPNDFEDRGRGGGGGSPDGGQ